MKFVHIKKDGSMDDKDHKITKKNICKTLTNLSNSEGNNSLQELYNWNYEKYTIHCYGWYDGEAGFENKHDLPPSGVSQFLESDSSEQLLFGDLFLVKMEKSKFVDFEVSDYGEFYNYMFGGFDECNSDDDESLNTEEEDEDYIKEETDESEIEEYEDEDDENDELGEDLNKY